jgi:SAM-dependent methyltransferase
MDCGYVQLQNMDDDTISEIYRDEAFNIEDREQKRERFRTLTENDSSKFENAKVLEIGGGRNAFLGVLPVTSKKWMTDFSIDDEVLAVVDGCFIGNFVDLDIPHSDFDYVVMFHVLEHFNDPSLALRKIKKLIACNGKVIIEVPNFACESKTRPDYTIFHMHISLFTQTSLIAFMMRNGFSCVNFFKKDEVLLAEFCLNNVQVPENHSNQSLVHLDNLQINIDNCATELHRILKSIGDDGLAIFGGGGSSTLFLFNYPFLINKVSCALDNDSNKKDKFLCNGNIPIIAPAEMKVYNIKHVITLQKEHMTYIGESDINYINVGDIYGR